MPELTLTTPPAAGAIAIVQLAGPGAATMLAALTGTAADHWPSGRLRLASFADVDTGLAVRFDDELVQLMPHGGPRIVARLLDDLTGRGARFAADPPATQLYPEADSPLEADALATLARAASPAAVDWLLAQPALWRSAPPPGPGTAEARNILARSDTLDRLVHPPTVVVVGQPNVGKSTLTNRLLGRTVSLVADLPGTTRDWVGATVELAGAPASQREPHYVAVRWLDTPGMRQDAGRVESAAIVAARQTLATADLLIAMRDPATDWPGDDDLPRRPDLYIINKIDTRQPEAERTASATPDAPLPISAEQGRNVDVLERRVLESLNLDELAPPTRWAFSPTLRALLHGEADVTWPAHIDPPRDNHV